MNKRLPKRKCVVLPAPVSKRLYSFIIDLLILNIVIFMPLSAAIPDHLITTNMFGTVTSELIIIASMTLALALAYFSVFERVLRATPGMMIARIRTKEYYPLHICLLRHAYFVAIFPISLLWIIEPIMLVTKKKRLLELLTKTETITEVKV